MPGGPGRYKKAAGEMHLWKMRGCSGRAEALGSGGVPGSEGDGGITEALDLGAVMPPHPHPHPWGPPITGAAALVLQRK